MRTTQVESRILLVEIDEKQHARITYSLCRETRNDELHMRADVGRREIGVFTQDVQFHAHGIIGHRIDYTGRLARTDQQQHTYYGYNTFHLLTADKCTSKINVEYGGMNVEERLPSVFGSESA